MFGGPLLAATLFLVLAIAAGWGLVKLFQSQLSQTSQQLKAGELDHGFEPDAVYTLKRDLLLGYLADGREALFPGREDLPRGVPGRRSAASVAEVRDQPQDFPDLIGVLAHTTRVRFTEVIDDRDNPQTRVLVLVEVLSGPYAKSRPVLGMHLESADTADNGQGVRYTPRSDLFEPVEPEPTAVQSPVKAP